MFTLHFKSAGLSDDILTISEYVEAEAIHATHRKDGSIEITISHEGDRADEVRVLEHDKTGWNECYVMNRFGDTIDRLRAAQPLNDIQKHG